MPKYFYTLIVLLSILPSAAFAAMVNINTADVTLLDTLPGIGPSKAAAIVDYRTAHGAFTSIEEIQQVKGIGPSTFAGLKPFISIDAAVTNQKPSAPPESTTKKQAITTAPPAQTTSVTKPVHAIETVGAPGTTSELAAPGALVAASDAAPQTSVSSIMSSYWSFGFLALVILAGGALMII